jgi:hypothetical protein
MFNDCVRLEDLKTHAKRFCYQYSNIIIHEKGDWLVYKFSWILE